MQRLTRIIALGYIAICLIALAGRALVGPLGYAPLPLIAGPARAPVVVTIWYGSEKQAWLEEAQRRFTASQPTTGGRPIQVQLKSLGSREMVERVASQDWRGETPPTALSPASAFWLDLASVPVARSGGAAPRTLALSPLVVIGWQDRAKALWPSGPRDFWRDLHDAIANPGGWKALGGSASWGLVKLGHTSPLKSNSGAQALMMMAYGFYGKSAGLSAADIANPEFAQWLREIESGVASFGDSSAALMTDIVNKGASQYDFAIVYENLAIESMDAARSRQGQPLQVFYPPAAMLSDHPFATLEGAWVKPEERAAAGQFRDFLLSRPIQELALRYGFRPVDQGVAVTSPDPANPFNKYAANGVQVALAGQGDPPPADATRALLELWRMKIGR